MATMTMQSKLPPHKRIGRPGASIAHLCNVARELINEPRYVTNQTHKVNAIVNSLASHMTNDDSETFFATIAAAYSNADIDRAHDATVDGYQSKTTRRRGRPWKKSTDDKSDYNSSFKDNFEKATDFADVDLDKMFNIEDNKPATNYTSSEPTVEPSTNATGMSGEELARLITTILQQALDPWDQRNNDGHKIINRDITALNTTLTALSHRVASIVEHRPTVIEVKLPELPDTVKLGLQHKAFPRLLNMCVARLNVWVYGPAGTGKSTAAEKCAEALGLPFYGTGSLSAPHEVFGYMDAHGKYIGTMFRTAWEHGGVYCLDEADASMPNAMLALNGALAGTLAAFPDGKMVRRHKDCIIIATANTSGHGASADYSGRFKMDAASLDRFATLHWPIDDALEAYTCGNQDWLTCVRNYRARLASHKITGVMITPRATYFGARLLAAGETMVNVIDSCIKKGMTDAQWALMQK